VQLLLSFRAIICFLIASLGLSVAARGGVITTYVGTVTSVDSFFSDGWQYTEVTVGDSIGGTIVYDAIESSLILNDPPTYDLFIGPNGHQLQLGGMTFEALTIQATLQQESMVFDGRIDAGGFLNEPIGYRLTSAGFQLSLAASSASDIPFPDLPSSIDPLFLQPGNGALFFVFDDPVLMNDDPEGIVVIGFQTQATQVVPEPSTAIACIGLIASGMLRIRRKLQ
jgi:hypothetical protein